MVSGRPWAAIQHTVAATLCQSPAESTGVYRGVQGCTRGIHVYTSALPRVPVGVVELQLGVGMLGTGRTHTLRALAIP